ncbi:hypothetical protein N474_02710 [Pseudoalteromonas luteoviolacea CPMOR-2]|uniref:TauD/TfdA family dioxygenase n=1 Tax=Pseudoalteromonas luteoviolacea TaxID=43657 RepID=UPI0007B04D56|nr:TauD/TfdA family dioxygenase [Pseudoalteromonas luteoviolacea]KZN52843.1 hypothetical protein N474_02710 [Pseudoalteromonas luteoviolacea CPMOR-2]
MDISDFKVSDLVNVCDQPLLLDVSESKPKALNWIEENKENINRLISENGALLIRGLKIHGSTQFGNILEKVFGGKLLEYSYRSTPRTEMRGNVFTATEYPEHEIIPQHNENAYSRSWPNRIGFLCLIPPETGGQTPISDSRLIYDRLPADVREKFEKTGVMYVRNYSHLDLPWQEVFQTENKEDVERFCADNGLKFKWFDNGNLRTEQINPAVQYHPETKEKLWFNQAHLFNVHSLAEDMRETLISTLGEDGVPRHTFYGDGTEIEPDVIKLINDLYESTKIRFDWQKGDLLLLDNMLFTHGRESFTGTRKVITGMACPNT